MDRKSTTIVIAVVLCAAWFAYSFGWFNRSRPTTETPSNTVSADQALGQDKTNVDVVPARQEAAEPIGSARE